MTDVRLKEPEEMNVLGLLLFGYLSHALDQPALNDRARKMRGSVALRSGPMWVTLVFDGQGIEIERGRAQTTTASVEGEMDTLLGVVTGHGMVGPFLKGQVRIGGNPFFLLKMLPILRAR